MCKNDESKVTVNELSELSLTIWGLSLLGWKKKDIATELGVHRNTITKCIKRVEAFVSQKFDIAKYKNALYMLTPLWLRSLRNNLESNDSALTIAFAKGMGIFVSDQAKGDNNSQVSVSVSIQERIEKQTHGLRQLGYDVRVLEPVSDN